jgi:acetyltransferase-like isoleucine patch superfamily enzyme
MIHYLRWLKSLCRRLRQDLANDLRRQRWWAQGVSISPLAILRTDLHSMLQIGFGSILGPYTMLDLTSDPLATSPTPSVLRIGRRTAIGEFSNIRASGSEIVIGDNCLLGQYVSIIGSNHAMARGQPIRDQPWNMTRVGVRIGDDVWIGTHAVILPGVEIGSGAVVAAGAIVTRDVPEYAVVAGMPATIRHYRE